ncbi:MAG: alpha-amylase family glycosyl hydrolase, partial [Alphaproteobacteria bacterium]
MIFPRHFFKALKFSLTAFVLCGVFAGCSEKPRYPWYETVSMYHVFVKSFFDSNGDGKGDLKGLTQKLDYIRSLNVNTIYMLPITPALNVPEMPRSHYGYEITDFKNIHPDYGTMEDFKTLAKEARKRGLHIVLDFITTVISVEHPFFQDILNNPDSKYKNWIITSPVIPEGE